jgi:drug/metabolite transporter (DMT)-like permease
MVFWAGNFVVVKTALAELPPVAFTSIRFALGAAVLLAVCKWREGSVLLPRRDLAQLAVLGAIGFAVYQALWTTALDHTTAADSALLIAATPIITALIAAAIGSDRLTPLMIVGALVSFSGVALVVLGSTGAGFEARALGNILTLVAAALWAVYVAFGAPVLRRHSPLRTTTWTVGFGTLFMLPLGMWEYAQADPHPTIVSLVAILYAGFISVSFGNVVQFWGVKILGPTQAVNFQFLVPALAVVLAAIFLNEEIRAEQVIGGIVIVLGIVVARYGRRPRPLPDG